MAAISDPPIVFDMSEYHSALRCLLLPEYNSTKFSRSLRKSTEVGIILVRVCEPANEFVVILLIVSSLLAYLSYRLSRHGIKRDCYDDWPFITGTFAVIGSIGALIAALVISYGAIGELLNPQYWAFQHLMADLKNLF